MVSKITFLSLAFSCSLASACWVNSSWFWHSWLTRPPEDKVWILRNWRYWCCWGWGGRCKDIRGCWSDLQTNMLTDLASLEFLIVLDGTLTWNRSKDFCLIGSPFVLLLRNDFNSTEIYFTFWLYKLTENDKTQIRKFIFSEAKITFLTFLQLLKIYEFWKGFGWF